MPESTSADMLRAATHGMEKITSPFIGSRTTDLARLLWRYRGSIDAPSKAAALLAVSAVFSPARGVEWALSHRALARHEMTDAPFFVVGHARSGTTHLFRLLTQDPQFGFQRVRQSLFPHMCGPTRPLVDRLLRGIGPTERPMDGVPFGPDEPGEEEGAVALTCGHSATLLLAFPSEARALFERWALLHDVPPDEFEQWQNAVRATFRKASWLDSGKRLVVKNPWNTARLTQLHEMWPDAPFLHIVRHPYGVYLSAWNALETGAPLVQFGDAAKEEVRDLFFAMYRDLMRQHLEQRALLPQGQYAEVRYEDLIADPVGELRAVYERLDLDGWCAFEPNLRRFVAAIDGYRTNTFNLERDLAERIADEWSFAFEQWGYDADVLVAEDDE